MTMGVLDRSASSNRFEVHPWSIEVSVGVQDAVPNLPRDNSSVWAEELHSVVGRRVVTGRHLDRTGSTKVSDSGPDGGGGRNVEVQAVPAAGGNGGSNRIGEHRPAGPSITGQNHGAGGTLRAESGGKSNGDFRRKLGADDSSKSADADDWFRHGRLLLVQKAGNSK